MINFVQVSELISETDENKPRCGREDVRVGLNPWFGGKSEWFGGTFKWLEGKPQKKKPELKKSELFKHMMHQMPKGLNFTARFTETCIHE